MRKKVRKSLAFLLALALVVSVMSGLGLSVSAEEEANAATSVTVPVEPEAEKEAVEPKTEDEESTPEEKESDENDAANPQEETKASVKAAANSAGDDYWDGGPGGGPEWPSTKKELTPSSYNKNSVVYWDTMIASQKKASSSDRKHVTSVTVNSTDVTQGDSDNAISASGGKKLSEYFPQAKVDYNNSAKMQSGSLTIVPAAGYYVTRVVVACVDSDYEQNPYKCRTWDAGNAFTTSFTVGTSGAVTITGTDPDKDDQFGSLSFSHTSGTSKYFILIEVMPIPTPLYVEYDYGKIKNYLGESFTSSSFSTASGWTTTNTGNAYGTGNIETPNTQYKYAYATGTAAAANWKHYANSVTGSAKEEAANVGYYFAGWEAHYYTTVTATRNQEGAYNNWTYQFKNSYGKADSNYSEGEQVALTTNVKLIAQWKPIKLNVKKMVSGLTGTLANESHSYKLKVEKKSGDNWVSYKEVIISVTGNSSEGVTTTLEKVPAGEYRVVEDSSNAGSLTGNNKVYNCTVSYSPASVQVTDCSDVKTLGVTNTYSDAPLTQDLTITKKVENLTQNPSYTFNAENTKYTFTVKAASDVNVGTEAYKIDGSDTTVTFNEAKEADVEITGAGSVKIEGLPLGTYTVTEKDKDDVTGYDFDSSVSNPANGEVTLTGSNAGTVEITNKYKIKKVAVYVKKELAGNMYNRSDTFDFTVTGHQGTLNLGKDDISPAYEVTYGGGFTVKETDSKGYTTSASAYKAIVSDTSVTQGAAITTGGEYEGSDKSYTLSNITEDVIIVYTNTKQITPPNGIITTIAPYAIMVVLAAGAAVYFVYSRRRHNG